MVELFMLGCTSGGDWGGPERGARGTQCLDTQGRRQGRVRGKE